MLPTAVTQTQGEKALAHYIQSLFALTTPEEVLVSRDRDTPLSWVRHMEGLKCRVGSDARTHDPEWVPRMWAAAPRHILSSQEGGGVPWQVVPVTVFMQRCRKSKCSTLQYQLAVTSLSLVYFLPTTQLFLPSS